MTVLQMPFAVPLSMTLSVPAGLDSQEMDGHIVAGVS